MTRSVLRLDQVSVVREGARLLDGVDWRVGEDERWVVLGSNGAGKTTLLSLASARLHPTRGSVEVLGARVGAVDLFELRTRVGVASAAVADRLPARERAVDVVMTAAYAVVGRARERYDAADEARARDLLARFGCRGLADRRYGSLSEGERKRVAIARALMPDPELLLLDEPAAGLDLGGREALLRRLYRLAADPGAPTTVLVTHHVEEIPAGFTHALLLRAGRIVAAGPLEVTLDSRSLSACFGLPLVCERAGGRWTARAARSAS